MSYDFSALEAYQHNGLKVLIAYEDTRHPGWAICKMENGKWGVYSLSSHTMYRVVGSVDDVNGAENVIHSRPIWHREK